MSQDELAVMDGGKCILQLRGVRPFLSDKYDITKHPNYPYTADADPKNAFDIEAFLICSAVKGVILSTRLNRPGWGHRRTKRTITKK